MGESRRAAFTIALLSAGAENFASVVAAREGRRESTVTMETSISLTHTTNPLGTHEGSKKKNHWANCRAADRYVFYWLDRRLRLIAPHDKPDPVQIIPEGLSGARRSQ